jgi:hypothetical protein
MKMPDAETRKTIEDMATKIAEDARDHAKETLDEGQYDMYLQCMENINACTMLLSMTGQYAVWKEVLATCNKIAEGHAIVEKLP